MPMRLSAKVTGIMLAAVVTASFGLSGCMWDQGAASEEELAKQVTYEDADTKPQVQRQTKDQSEAQETSQTENQSKSQAKDKSKKKTSAKSTSSEVKKTGDGTAQ